MKERKAAWILNAANLVRFLGRTPDENVDYLIHLTPESLDMTGEGWYRVGTANIEYTFEPTNELYRVAMAACEDREQELREEFQRKLQALQEVRRTLQALPAPSTNWMVE